MNMKVTDISERENVSTLTKVMLMLIDTMKTNWYKKIETEALYIATLPERTVRSVVSMVMGVTSLGTKLLVPKMIKDSSTYKVTFGMLQQFLIQKIAEVEEEKQEFQVKDQYMVRKMAGSFIEGIGLFSFHFSPVWLLAIISDVTGGSTVYLDRLIKDMKKQNIIEEDKAYPSVYDLLEGIHESSKMGVDVMDLPPINREEWLLIKNQLGTQFQENASDTKAIFKDLEMVWQKMNQIGKAENLSLSKLNGTMTLSLMKSSGKKGVDITKSTVLSSYQLFHEVVIRSYLDSIEEVQLKGKKQYFSEHMAPFVKQFSRHYDKSRKTLTEKLLRNGRKGLK